MAKITEKSRLTAVEKRVQEDFITGLGIKSSKDARPGKIVAMVGSIGPGKSSIAKMLAMELGAVVIEGDAIRVLLRKAKAGYDHVWEIGKNAVMAAAESGKNVVIDGDASRIEKRKMLLAAAKHIDADIVFVRAICCDFDILLGRIITSPYMENSFFGGANTTWKGSFQERGAVVKMREFLCLLRRHYQPEKTQYPGRDNWVPKTLSFVHFVIDTTDEKKWPQEAKRIARQIRLR